MSWIARNLWLIPVLPLVASGIALAGWRHRWVAAGAAILSMFGSLALSCCALASLLAKPIVFGFPREFHNITWFEIGSQPFEIGWVLDPISALMLVMVTFVGLLIFIYSIGYMADDPEFGTFFSFLSFFAAAMLGLVIANNLLLLFICWELVGLASYLLIGFWHQKPSAAAAAKKAFITTRIGDIGFFLGMIWLYSETGSLLFYDQAGNGCLEASTLGKLAGQTIAYGLGLSTILSLLIFCGAIGKSGQVPLHVWLPDAMEGPTPVSALIHAATMVAAGVYLVARVFPLMDADPQSLPLQSTALTVVTWTGAITALFAALIAVAQTDIKRILAYSTVSQLGFMMMGLGMGGVAVGMFHLLTHAFFKALLFLGAGSVIHAYHGEQDIRKMGNLRKYAPVTFATYAIGMLALAGFPLLAGFWSKDAILHSAHQWPVSHGPFYLGVAGALLTAFYMTRQVCYVFFGADSEYTTETPLGIEHARAHPHESPAVMTIPLILLAVGAVAVGFLGTPAWPWMLDFMAGKPAQFHLSGLAHGEFLIMALISTCIVLIGLGVGWWLYHRRDADDPDTLEIFQPGLYTALNQRLFVDEMYQATIGRFTYWIGAAADCSERRLFDTITQAAASLTLALAWLNRFFDEFVVNWSFDKICAWLRRAGAWTSTVHQSAIQTSLTVLGLSLTVLALLFIWGLR